MFSLILSCLLFVAIIIVATLTVEHLLIERIQTRRSSKRMWANLEQIQKSTQASRGDDDD